MGEVCRCPRCGNMAIYYDYGLKKLVCAKCKAPLRDFIEG